MSAEFSYVRGLMISAATALVALFAFAPAANAGDLGGDEYIEQGAYDYEDSDDRDDGRRYARHDDDDDEDDEDEDARGSYKDGHYLRPYGHPPRFSENDDRNGSCVPRQVIKHELAAQGWCHFSNAEPRGSVVVVTARRSSGQLHRLTVDRCSGRVLEARIVDEVPPEALAERNYYRQYRTY